jgi:hypothetical protein
MAGRFLAVLKLKKLRHKSNLVELKPRNSVHKSITQPLITAMGSHDIAGSQLRMGFANIDKPETQIGIKIYIRPNRDRWIFLFGTEL